MNSWLQIKSLYDHILSMCDAYRHYQLNILRNRIDLKWIKRNPISNFKIPRQLSDNETILWIGDQDNRLLSMLYVAARPFHNRKALIYAYSWTNENARGIGLSKLLRLMTISYAFDNEYEYVISLPFEEAMSNILLDSMGFKEENGTRYLRIPDLNVKSYIIRQLSKRCNLPS